MSPGLLKCISARVRLAVRVLVRGRVRVGATVRLGVRMIWSEVSVRAGVRIGVAVRARVRVGGLCQGWGHSPGVRRAAALIVPVPGVDLLLV